MSHISYAFNHSDIEATAYALPFCLVLDLQNQKPRQKLIINSVVLRRKN